MWNHLPDKYDIGLFKISMPHPRPHRHLPFYIEILVLCCLNFLKRNIFFFVSDSQTSLNDDSDSFSGEVDINRAMSR